jgi:hypothetical protein
MDCSWSAHGLLIVLMESESIWTAHGLLMESSWSLHGVLMESVECSWTHEHSDMFGKIYIVGV